MLQFDPNQFCVAFSPLFFILYIDAEPCSSSFLDCNKFFVLNFLCFFVIQHYESLFFVFRTRSPISDLHFHDVLCTNSWSFFFASCFDPWILVNHKLNKTLIRSSMFIQLKIRIILWFLENLMFPITLHGITLCSGRSWCKKQACIYHWYCSNSWS